MNDETRPTSPAPPDARGVRRLAGTLFFLGTLGVTGTAGWLYLRRQQKRADARTRERLAPHTGAAA